VLLLGEVSAATKAPTVIAETSTSDKALLATISASRRLVSGRATVRSHRSHLCGSFTTQNLHLRCAGAGALRSLGVCRGISITIRAAVLVTIPKVCDNHFTQREPHPRVAFEPRVCR
jgi:hypothetical protein